MNLPPYVADVLSQPEALRAALDQYPAGALASINAGLESGQFKRVVITGMGASLSGVYPAWLKLSHLGLPVSWVETSELLHYALEQVTPDTLLIVVSQSGRSAEIASLIEAVRGRAGLVLGVTNEPGSPLGQGAQVVLPLASGAEYTVSTRSYLNTLAVTQLMALELTGGDLAAGAAGLRQALDPLAAYLKDWQARVAELKEKIGLPPKMLFLGRGPSLAAVTTGALIMKEAAKCTVEGMSAPQFRHGPLELADESLTVLMFAGPERTQGLNRELALKVASHGGRAFWIAPQADAQLPTLLIPDVAEIARPLAEILPLQMLSIVLAELTGREPGKFRNIGKVVLEE